VRLETKSVSGLGAQLAEDLDGAFAELVTRFEANLYSTALRLTGDTERALDLTAEAYSRAYGALRGYEKRRIRQLELRPWLITILLNLWRNECRALARHPRPVELSAIDEPASTDEGVEERLERLNETTELASLLAYLPERERIAVVLRHVVGLDYGEVASALSCPLGTAKSHVHRGLKRLKEQVAARPKEAQDVR
jgi:RNA polymerase sigma factor (sigma-70 family)